MFINMERQVQSDICVCVCVCMYVCMYVCMQESSFVQTVQSFPITVCDLHTAAQQQQQFIFHTAAVHMEAEEERFYN